MERKWTKGPWRNAGTRYQAIVADADTGHDDPESVAAYGGHLVAESVTAPNAHLIAAAPDLYEALDMVNNSLCYLAPWEWDQIAAALAKARGET